MLGPVCLFVWVGGEASNSAVREELMSESSQTKCM